MKSQLFTASLVLGLALQATAQNVQRSQLQKPVLAASTLEFPAASFTNKRAATLTDFVAEPWVNYDKDVQYAVHDGVSLKMQILSPERTNADVRLPAIIYIEGSAWMKQDVYSPMARLMKFAERGFAIFSAEYRGTNVEPFAYFPAQVVDAKAAIRFVRANAEKYHIDPNNIFIWGDSSGGHTALMAGFTEGVTAFDTKENSVSAKVNAIVDYYGPTDITRMNMVPSVMDHTKPESPEGMLIGNKDVMDNLETASKTNPLNYLSNDRPIPPVLIIHGNRDRLVPLLMSDLLANRLDVQGKSYEFYVLKDADHGSYEFCTDKAYDIVEAFLRKNLK